MAAGMCAGKNLKPYQGLKRGWRLMKNSTGKVVPEKT